MFLPMIVWTLFCATIIIVYSLFLCKKENGFSEKKRNVNGVVFSESIEVHSYELVNNNSSWSYEINAPVLTDEIILNYPVLFYIKTSDGFVRVPNPSRKEGYKVSVSKKEGKVYLSFKSMVDEVSNFHLPSNYLIDLKVMIIKPEDNVSCSEWGAKTKEAIIFNKLRSVGVDVNDYESVLMHFNDLSKIQSNEVELIIV